MLKAMNFVVACIARHEGKKSQVKIGNIREVLKIIMELKIKDPEFRLALLCLEVAYLGKAVK